MRDDPEGTVRDLVFQAEQVTPAETSPKTPTRPKLLIEHANPDRTVTALRDVLASAGDLYDRGLPVRLTRDQFLGCTVAQAMTPELLTMTVHTVCRPFMRSESSGDIAEKDIRLPQHVARTYLEWRGDWQLPPLNGITSVPSLVEDGTIRSTEGYDAQSGMWHENVPDLAGLIPSRPSLDDAVAALRTIRDCFKTFCFADAETLVEPATTNGIVDVDQPPGRDESAFLAALFTAVCRPSLRLAPGILLRAPSVSGAGTGKGLLARCISLVAFGREPHAVTGGATTEELEKRIASELMEGGPVVFLDNLNNRAFRSDLLASAITERPAKVRILGKSQMVPLNATALIILTGNGLSVSEDLARRFITVELDSRTENPEERTFPNDIRKVVAERRCTLLAAVLTVWRWGRQHNDLCRGRTLGSFEQWGAWVRDPLLALGCQDPVDRIGEGKERDNERQMITEVFSLWWSTHHEKAVAIRDLAEDVIRLIDPQGRGRQYVSSRLERLTGTRIAGFVLTRQPSAGKWGVATYALTVTGGRPEHRGHRGHRGDSAGQPRPFAPDAP
ncbi:MAG: hypothetical protein RII27_03760, partial [Alphaproteobacteria bacterium]